MKKTIFGIVAAGVLVGFGQVARRMRHNMREHCSQMAGHFERRGEVVGNGNET